MAGQKQKAGTFTKTAEAGPTSMQSRLESTIESFERKWGMELTQGETQKVMDSALSRMGESGKLLKVRPAVRDEMFAMLIKKDPEKAISFRMEVYENRGKKIGAAEKNAVMRIAKQDGFRAAREELKHILSAKKSPARKKAGAATVKEMEVGAAPKRKKARKESSGETEAEQAYRLAMQKNMELARLLGKCKKELAALDREYYGDKGKIGKSADEREGEALVKEYKGKVAKIQGRYLDETNRLKKERDSHTAKYVEEGTRTIVGDEKVGGAIAKSFIAEQTRELTQFEGLSSVGAGYGVKKFKKSDLDLQGSAESNVGNFDRRMRNWEAERKKRAKA